MNRFVQQRYGDSVFYTYKDEYLTFCSQITNEGVIQFSYAYNGEDVIFASDAFMVSDILGDLELTSTSRENFSNTNDQVNTLVVENLGNFTIAGETRVSSSGAHNRGPSSSLLISLFGQDYDNVVHGFSSKKHEGISYSVWCHGFQSTYELKGYAYQFIAQTALTTIITWLLGGAFSATIAWFVSAAAAVVETVNNIDRIKAAISGNMYAYTCLRQRVVTITGIPGTMYSAAWGIRKEIILNGSTWDAYTYYEGKQRNLLARVSLYRNNQSRGG